MSPDENQPVKPDHEQSGLSNDQTDQPIGSSEGTQASGTVFAPVSPPVEMRSSASMQADGQAISNGSTQLINDSQSGANISPSNSYLTRGQKKKNRIVLILLVLLLVAGMTTLAFFAFSNNSRDKESTGSTDSTTIKDSNKQSVAHELLVATYTTHKSTSQSPVEISVQYPKDWKLEQDGEIDLADGGPASTPFLVNGEMRIISPKGNVLAFSDTSFGGRGGGCEENVTVQLVKRIPTKQSNLVFEQIIHHTHPSMKEWQSIRLVNLDKRSSSSDEEFSRYLSLQEGDNFTGDCNIFFSYSKVSNEQGDSDITVSVQNKDGQLISYDDFKDDTDFIEVLKTFDVKQ